MSEPPATSSWEENITIDATPRRLSGVLYAVGIGTSLEKSLWITGGIGVAVGSTLAVMISGVLPWGDPPRGNKFGIMVVVCGIFILAGLISVAHACAAAHMRHRRARSTARNPGEPAMADYPWERTDSVGRTQRGLGLLPMVVMVSLMMGLSNYFLYTEDIPWIIRGVIWIGSLVAILLWISVIVAWIRRLKFAPGKVAFQTFPFRTGSDAKMTWRYHRAFHQLDQATFTLRCIEEKWVGVKSPGRQSNTLVHEQKWSAKLNFSGTDSAGKQEFPLSFPIPANAEISHLSGIPAIYWQLTVEVQVPGLNLQETHLIPVYGN